MSIPRVLSIAGTDPTGGAGIQADLKSIAANGGYGMAVVTALVSQNTTGVRDIHVPPAAFLAEQLAAVSDDVEIDAVKIGMLFDEPLVEVVAAWLDRVRPPIVVLDPVMVASSGDRLLSPGAEAAVRGLLARVDLVTPNLPELAALLGEPVAETWDAALAQARALSERFGVRVLAKGGHLDGADSPDALVEPSGDGAVAFSAARVDTRNTHGTGCSLSSAVATLAAHGLGWVTAVRDAKAWLTESIRGADALQVGRGSGPVSHFAGAWARVGAYRRAPESVAREWWTGVAEVRAGIDRLAFVRGLADGTLPDDAFRWYLAQDALYLRDYARVLAAASRMAPTPQEQAFWAQSAHGSIVAELELHAQWVDADRLFDAAPSPVTTAYLDHLHAAASRGYGELVAALLPCFWMYADVGERLRTRASDEHPYGEWLRTYGDPDFAELTRRAIAIVTAHAAVAPDAERSAMRRAFEASTRHESAFFAAPLLP